MHFFRRGKKYKTAFDLQCNTLNNLLTIVLGA